MATKPLALGLAIAALLAGPADAAVTLKIKNQSGQQVWVMWTGTTSLTGSAGAAVPAIAPSDMGSNAAGYDLSTFQNVGTNEYQISGFTMDGGRMWFTYGASSWTFNNAGYTPPVATFTDPNFTKRYDKIEASITGSKFDNLDITAVDAFSIPFTVTGYNSQSKATTTQVLNGSIGAIVQGALGAIAANAYAYGPVTPAGATPPLTQIAGFSPYLFINQNSLGSSTVGGYRNSPIGTTGAFVRIIANDNLVAPLGNDPVKAANGGAVPANYNWMNYLNLVKRMDGRAAPFAGTTTLAGSYAGVKPFSTTLTSPAVYSLTATFNPTEVLVADYNVPGTGTGTGPYQLTTTGAVTISGTATIAGAQYTVILKIPYGGAGNYTIPAGFGYPNAFMLDPSGIVGANANYFYKFYLTSNGDPSYWSQTDPYNKGPQNNLLTWIESDLFAGMNVGAVGSDKTFTTPITINGTTYPAGTKVGTFKSQDWFSLGANLAAAAAAAAGTNAPGSPYDYYFGYLQPSPEFYNQYAETIYPLTDAYGFAYSDRIQGGRVAIAWDATQAATAIDTIEITILPDRGLPFDPGHVHATEYHHPSLDHYFVTHAPDEIAKLDAGTEIKGWRRTGRTIAVYPTPQPGTTPVCRHRIPPEHGDSHFLGRDPAECSATASKHPGFVLESEAFMHMVMPTQGVCPANTSPLYRVYSNRADANHRYVNDRATRSQMIARGWVAEGDGSDRVTLCAPL